MPPGASPPRASRWAPQSQGRCWLRDMKLFALHGAGFDPLSHLLQLVLPVPVWHSQAWAKRQHCGLRVMGHCLWVPLALLGGRLPLQGGQELPYCCAGFITVRLMLVIGSFYHLSVSSQLLKPPSAWIYYLANKYKCRFILPPCSSERNENVSKILKIK